MRPPHWSLLRSVLVVLSTSVVVVASAQQRATRQDGVPVILHPDGRWELAPSTPAARTATPVVAASERAGAVSVFFGNLHSHTSYSDGSATPADAYRPARDVADLDFLAVTEHNHAGAPSRIEDEPHLYNGSQASSLISAARRFTEDGVFVALNGQERGS